ncbi:hypothetical protein Trydic_g5607 [Trypoxylus dichotomus]
MQSPRLSQKAFAIDTDTRGSCKIYRSGCRCDPKRRKTGSERCNRIMGNSTLNCIVDGSLRIISTRKQTSRWCGFLKSNIATACRQYIGCFPIESKYALYLREG